MARWPRNRTGGRAPAPPGASFRWPQRSRSEEAERAAQRAADLALERLRARRRTPPPPRRAIRPARPEPPKAPQPPTPRPVSLEDTAELEVLPGPEPEPESAAPDPWGADLEDLTEELVAELHRDLGPAGN